MNEVEYLDFLDTIGAVEGKLDGLFVGVLLPSFDYDEAGGYKLIFDHENIKESSFKSVLEEAKSRGKIIAKTTVANREMTIIYTPRARP
jgi:hypothetical protein